jgi:hypothetical protein
MDVHFVIDRDPSGGLQVVILSSSPAKSWKKMYETKMQCLSELFALGWLTASGFVDAQASDFDISGRPSLSGRTSISISRRPSSLLNQRRLAMTNKNGPATTGGR